MQDMIYISKKEGVKFSLTTVTSEVRSSTQKKPLQQETTMGKYFVKISKFNLKYVQCSFYIKQEI
jgi:hypothetical protein